MLTNSAAARAREWSDAGQQAGRDLPDWSIDEAELRAAFNDRTRAIVVNTPHNPTGKIFTRAELGLVAELAQRWDTYVLTDEIFEHNPTSSASG